MCSSVEPLFLSMLFIMFLISARELSDRACLLLWEEASEMVISSPIMSDLPCLIWREDVSEMSLMAGKVVERVVRFVV